MQQNITPKLCIHCNNPIVGQPAVVARAKYCSHKCYSESKVGKAMSNREGEIIPCKTCGKTIYRAKHKLSQKTGNFCGYKCYWEFRKGYNSGKDHPNWKEGRTHAHGGYYRVWDNGKRRYEHIVVMEKHLGRKLKRLERVHHIDLDPSNNSIENLVVMNHAEHIRYHKNLKR